MAFADSLDVKVYVLLKRTRSQNLRNPLHEIELRVKITTQHIRRGLQYFGGRAQRWGPSKSHSNTLCLM